MIVYPFSEEMARTLSEPRSDLLIEDVTSADEVHIQFRQQQGPFDHYLRTVVFADDTITETIDFRLGLPFWNFLIHPLMKRALRDPNRVPRGRWWWPQQVLTPTTTHVLSVLTVLAIVAGYMGVVIGQTITFAAEQFEASDTNQADTLAAVRIGVLFSTIIIGRADRIGRRPLLLGFCAVALGLTVLTATAQSMLMLGMIQAVARGFTTGLLTLLTLAATEEVPASVRAVAVSLMAMCSALGGGMVLWILPVAGTSPDGWRVVYAAAIVFAPVVWWAWRRLPETRRYLAADNTAAPAPVNRRRFALIAFSAFAGAMFLSPASQLQNEYLNDDIGWTAGQISLFRMIVSTPAGLGLLAAGVLADRRGRRVIGAVGLAVGALASALFFSSTGAGLWLFGSIGVWLLAAAYPALRGYQTELFPTRSRARVGGWIDLISVSGSALGLVIAGRAADRLGGLGEAMWLLVGAPLVVAVLIVVAYPETARTELEAFNPDDPTMSS